MDKKAEKFKRYRDKWLQKAIKEITKLGGTIIDEKNLDFYEEEGRIPEAIVASQPHAKAAIVIMFSHEITKYTFTIPFVKMGLPLPAEIVALVDKQLSQVALHKFGRGWLTNEDSRLKTTLDEDRQLKKIFRGFYNSVKIGNTSYPYEFDMQTIGYDDNTTYIGARPGLSETILGRTCGIMDGVKAIEQIQTHFKKNVGKEFGLSYYTHFGKVHFINYL